MFNFPDREEIRLAASPIQEVICQVRFPIILRIGKEEPAGFQDRVRDRFPHFEVEMGIGLQPEGFSAEGLKIAQQPPVYQFRTANKETKISLSNSFFALSTTGYQHWTDFKALLDIACRAATEEYQIPISNRVGLRFINHITTRNPGIATIDELIAVIRPQLSGLLNTDAWDLPAEMLARLVLTGDPGHVMTLRIGFKTDIDNPLLLLDIDRFFTNDVETTRIPDMLEQFHRDIYGAFRWSIPDNQLHLFSPEQEP